MKQAIIRTGIATAMTLTAACSPASQEAEQTPTTQKIATVSLEECQDKLVAEAEFKSFPSINKTTDPELVRETIRDLGRTVCKPDSAIFEAGVTVAECI